MKKRENIPKIQIIKQEDNWMCKVGHYYWFFDNEPTVTDVISVIFSWCEDKVDRLERLDKEKSEKIKSLDMIVSDLNHKVSGINKRLNRFPLKKVATIYNAANEIKKYDKSDSLLQEECGIIMEKCNDIKEFICRK